MSGLQHPIPKWFQPEDAKSENPTIRMLREIDYKIKLHDPIPFPESDSGYSTSASQGGGGARKKASLSERVKRGKLRDRGKKLVKGIVGAAMGQRPFPAAPQPAPARQPPPPQNTGSVNKAQVNVRSLSSITPRGGGGGGGGAGGGGGGGGGGPYRGGGGGGAPRGPRAPRKPRAQKVGGQPVRKTVKPKGIRKPRKVKSAPAAPTMRQSVKKPKRDITKITTPKPKAKPRQAIGTAAKRVGGGKKVRQVEQTKPLPRGRIRGENTAPRGRGPRATY